jgi:hypothetical protein
MTIEFMSQVAAIIAERRQSVRLGKPHGGNIAAHSIVSEPERAASGVESQGPTNVQTAPAVAVIDEAQRSEPIHEEANPRPRGPHHLCQSRLI